MKPRVPEFSFGPALMGADNNLKREAERLCEHLTAKWLRCGWSTAKFWVEEVAGGPRQTIYGVRSNLVNGLPPARGSKVAA